MVLHLVLQNAFKSAQIAQIMKRKKIFFIAPSDSFDLWVAIVELHVGDIERVTSSSNKAKVILRTCYDCRAMPNTKINSSTKLYRIPQNPKNFISNTTVGAF